MNKTLLFSICCIILLAAITTMNYTTIREYFTPSQTQHMSGESEASTDENTNKNSNIISDDRMLLVLSAPSVHDEYYAPALQAIVDFQIDYARSIMENDNVVIIVDQDTKHLFKDNVPEDILLVADVDDIWMRDFTTVNPFHPTQFTYTWASMNKSESKDVQSSFTHLANSLRLKRNETPLLIDGGNIVDNYKGGVITTTRFLSDNKLSIANGKKELQSLLGATDVAILEPDEELLAHSDGMVAWIDDDVLLVNEYSEDEGFGKSVLSELSRSFPTTKILTVPVEFQENKEREWEDFSSSCGVNLNLVLTKKNIYVPTFGLANDDVVLDIIRKNTTKNVVPVEARSVCPMGGSVRCLTWQVAGENAAKIIEAARASVK